MTSYHVLTKRQATMLGHAKVGRPVADAARWRSSRPVCAGYRLLRRPAPTTCRRFVRTLAARWFTVSRHVRAGRADAPGRRKVY